MSVRRALTGAVLALGLALSACGSDEPAIEFTGITHDPYPVPSTPLTDTDGQSFSLADDTDKPLTLVFFGYTHCPDLCPMVMSSLTSGLTRLSEEDRADVDVVFVTTDPGRDTPEVLRGYLDHYDPGFIGLTGELQTIVGVGEPLAVAVGDGSPLPSGGYDLNAHSTQVTAIGPDDTSTVLWKMDTSSAEFAADIQALLEDYR